MTENPDRIDREALEKMARDGCGETRITPAGDGVRYIHKRCRDLWPDGQDRWCWSCQADFALQAERDEHFAAVVEATLDTCRDKHNDPEQYQGYGLGSPCPACAALLPAESEE